MRHTVQLSAYMIERHGEGEDHVHCAVCAWPIQLGEVCVLDDRIYCALSCYKGNPKESEEQRKRILENSITLSFEAWPLTYDD